MRLNVQKELDIKKWIESERAKRDLCSTYNYCSKCDKTKENPCAIAYTLYNKKEKPNVLSFQEKLDNAKDATKDKFKELCLEIKASGVKVRICKKNVTLRYNKQLIGLISLTRNSLKIHLAIDPQSHNEIPNIDYSSKKTYQQVPFTIKLTTKKLLKDACALVDEIIESE